MNPESDNTVMKLWLLMDRAHDSVVRCGDSLSRGYGLTMQQFGVHATVKGDMMKTETTMRRHRPVKV